MTLRKSVVFVVFFFLSFMIQPLSGASVSDVTDPGPMAVTSAEYKLPAGFDPVVLGVADEFPFPFRLQTELWARVYRPSPTPNNSLYWSSFMETMRRAVATLERARDGSISMFNTQSMERAHLAMSRYPVTTAMHIWLNGWLRMVISSFRLMRIAE